MRFYRVIYSNSILHYLYSESYRSPPTLVHQWLKRLLVLDLSGWDQYSVFSTPSSNLWCWSLIYTWNLDWLLLINDCQWPFRNILLSKAIAPPRLNLYYIQFLLVHLAFAHFSASLFGSSNQNTFHCFVSFAELLRSEETAKSLMKSYRNR